MPTDEKEEIEKKNVTTDNDTKKKKRIVPASTFASSALRHCTCPGAKAAIASAEASVFVPAEGGKPMVQYAFLFLRKNLHFLVNALAHKLRTIHWLASPQTFGPETGNLLFKKTNQSQETQGFGAIKGLEEVEKI
jgi:hypothetical protein